MALSQGIVTLDAAEKPRENSPMTRKKAKPAETPFDPWKAWLELQLTPEQKAEARARTEAQSEEAARNRVWEQFLELEGKVHLDMDDVREAREDRD